MDDYLLGLDPQTQLVRAKADVSQANPVATPIFQASAFRSGDPYFYTRNANPNFQDVEELFTQLDRGAGAVLYSSGMAAIDAALEQLKPGQRLVVHRLIYGCSYRFLNDYSERLGIDVEFADLSDPAARAATLAKGADMVFFETPTNPFLHAVDVRKVVAEAKAARASCLVVVDNTWATPLFQRPLELGADLAVYSCSKFFSGHSDIIMGIAVANSEELVEKIKKRRFYGGSVPDPFAAWLLRRSMQTLGVRMRAHVENTEAVSQFVGARPEVAKMYLPEVDGQQLQGYGGMLFFQMKDDASGDKADRFAAALKLFDRGTPLATVTSAVAIPYTGSHLSMTDEEKAGIGLGKDLVRLSLGIEAATDLVADLKQAFEAL
jgi:cystathionine beta-lyase/cystathionine gamma-synthase